MTKFAYGANHVDDVQCPAASADMLSEFSNPTLRHFDDEVQMFLGDEAGEEGVITEETARICWQRLVSYLRERDRTFEDVGFHGRELEAAERVAAELGWA